MYWEGSSSAVPVVDTRDIRTAVLPRFTGPCYSSLREVERMRPFNRCFGCAMNIKGLGYPYEKFAVCIRPISPCYPFVIRTVDKIQ